MSELTAFWSRPESERAGTPLLLALHGRGSNENSMAELAPHLPARFTLAALRGPLELAPGAYTWFENRGIGRPVGASIKETASRVFSWLDEFAGQHDSVSLLGFSGGTAMAGALLLSKPARFTSAVLLSGTLPWDAGINDDAGRLSGEPIFWGLDPDENVIPADLLARSDEWLVELSGAALERHHYSGLGHAISEAELRDVATFLEANVS